MSPECLGLFPKIYPGPEEANRPDSSLDDVVGVSSRLIANSLLYYCVGFQFREWRALNESCVGMCEG